MTETRKLAAILGFRCRRVFAAGADEKGTLAQLRAVRGDPDRPRDRGPLWQRGEAGGAGSIIEFRSVIDAVLP